MAKATIRSKTGAVIAIEGTEKEVADILATIERTAAVGQAKAAISKGRAEKKEQKKRANASDLVVGLKEEGFFKRKQGLAEVRTTLSENGYHYSRQAVHVALNNLTRKGGPLVSLEESGRKVYVERK